MTFISTNNDVPHLDEPLSAKIQSCAEMIQGILKANDLLTDRLTLNISADFIAIYSKNEHTLFCKGKTKDWVEVATDEN